MTKNSHEDHRINQTLKLEHISALHELMSLHVILMITASRFEQLKSDANSGMNTQMGMISISRYLISRINSLKKQVVATASLLNIEPPDVSDEQDFTTSIGNYIMKHYPDEVPSWLQEGL